ncbi:MAG: CxxxxCH/CxxCH domain c-type cytochrome [Desulfobacteria bacterium]
MSLFFAASLPAGMTGSPHDFSAGSGPYTQSTTIAPSGTCSACHVPHGADISTLWSRNLTDYRTLLIANGTGTYQINYVHAPTIQCYDCHDNHTTGNIDDSPASSVFSVNHKPQDVAFGGDGPQGVAGYYENNPPDNTALKGADPNLNPNDNVQLSRTGGHYFKYMDPDGGTGAFRKGDKLSCRDCHDPHQYSGTWRVFIRADLPTNTDVTSLSPLYGSELMTNQSTGSHDNSSSRRICVSCHSYSNTSTLPVQYSQIGSWYTQTSRIPKPPTTVAEHSNSPAVSNVPCVLCHKHNYIDANCAGCHGFPPNPYPPDRRTTPTGGSPLPAVTYTSRDPHPQHVGRADGQASNSFSIYGFECKVCHATSALGSRTQTGVHNTGSINVAYDMSALGVPDPSDVTSTGKLTCANVYCHSTGGSDNTVAGYYQTVQWGVTPAPLLCNSCHGAGTTSGTAQYGMPNYTSGAAGSATANTHMVHVVNGGYECSVCHFATVQGTFGTARTIKASPLRHVNGSRDVVFDGTNATGSYNVDNTVQANNKRCDVSCHGTGKALLLQPQWGGTLANGCFDCHSGTEQIYKPQIDYGTAGTPNPVDNNEYLYSGHGRPLGSNYPGSNNLPAGFSNYTTAPVACYVCHSQGALHTTKSANDLFRLGSTTDGTQGGLGSYTGAWADNTDALCLGCHGSSTQRSGHDGPADNAAKGTGGTINAQTHARGITGVKYNWPVTPWKCVDCHDPHGDGKSGADRYMMIRSGINAPIDNTDSNAGSDAQSRPKRTGSNVLAVGFNSLAGYSTTAGVYSYANQGNGPTTWGPCEVCHTQTTAYSRTADNLGSHATRTNRCTTCHPHKAGFAPTACKGCHGPDGVATAAAAPNVGTYWAAGGHGKFTTGSPSRPIECEDCHDTSYLTASDHKTDGSVPGNPPNNINTLGWPGKTPLDANTNPNANTSHLKSGYINTTPSTRADVARTFDTYCVTACHAADYHRHWKPTGAAPQDVMRFGDPGTSTTSNPKQYNWMTIAAYATDFYRTQSVWIDSDSRVSGLVDNTNYGLCVSCHDPHGTGVTDTSGYPGLGTTNHMLRGNWITDAGTFCGRACHTSRPAP